MKSRRCLPASEPRCWRRGGWIPLGNNSGPNSWRAVNKCLVNALAARRCMTDDSLPRYSRDEATVAYVRATDELVEELARLRSAGILELIDQAISDGLTSLGGADGKDPPPSSPTLAS